MVGREARKRRELSVGSYETVQSTTRTHGSWVRKLAVDDADRIAAVCSPSSIDSSVADLCASGQE